MRNVLQKLILTTLITFSLNNAFATNYYKIAEREGGKAIFLTPTCQLVECASDSFGYTLNKDKFVGKASISGNIVSSNGARSISTVPATITQGVSKRAVMGEILDKARVGGKAFGKGAATVGKVGLKGNLYSIAFGLALEALIDSEFFWSDDAGDFVKKPTKESYFIFKTKEQNSPPESATRESLAEWCRSKPSLISLDKNNRSCSDIEIVEASGHELSKLLLDKCGSKFIKYNDGKKEGTFKAEGRDAMGHCYAKRQLFGIVTASVKVVENIPITLDEFIDEGTPEAAGKPDEWVKTSQVEPSPDETPTVGVIGPASAQSSPYTDPQTGKAKQTRWDIDKDGNIDEYDVNRPDLTPDSPEAPKIEPPKDLNSGSSGTGDKSGDETDKGDKDKKQPETESFDLCKEHPNILACDKTPTAPEPQEYQIPVETKDLMFAPDTIFPTTGICPAPVSFVLDFPYIGSKTFAFEYTVACDVATKIRGIIIALAWIFSALLVVKATRAT